MRNNYNIKEIDILIKIALITESEVHTKQDETFYFEGVFVDFKEKIIGFTGDKLLECLKTYSAIKGVALDEGFEYGFYQDF